MNRFRLLHARLPLLALVVATSLVAAAPAATPGAAGQGLLEVVEDYYEQQLELFPILATHNGDNRFNDRLSVAIAPEHRKKTLDLERTYLARVEGIAPAALSDAAKLTRTLFLHGRRESIAGMRFPDHLLPVDQFNSTPVVFGMLGGGGSIQPFETVKDYENWLGRIEFWSAWVDQAVDNMREGVERGIVQPRILMERTLPILAAQVVDDPEESPFWRPIATMPASIPAEDRSRLARLYATAITEKVVAPYARLHDFIRDEYLPRTRKTVGLAALPNGAAWYRHLVRTQTTTNMTPQQIHAIGVSEVARIETEIVRARNGRWGRGGASTPHGPLLAGYEALGARVAQRLPELFAQIPAAPFEVRPVESFRRGSAAGASYVAATPDGSRPGVFYVNADASARGTPSEALFLHEAVPGHHFQISLQRELGDLPRFRRFGHFTAFSEGWALYAERLGRDLGLYTDRDQSIRALRSELFRARRLVVDTGLHAMGWSRQQAIDYIGSPTEVDRYIAIPGQALAYKVGQMRILQLRADAEKALGDAFDIRGFHQAVLGGGAMPLDVLEQRVARWIERARTHSKMR